MDTMRKRSIPRGGRRRPGGAGLYTAILRKGVMETPASALGEGSGHR